MSSKIYKDPDEELGKFAMKIEKSYVEYYTIKFQDKTIEKKETYDEAVAWVESLIKENYGKPIMNRHRFFRRSQLIQVSGEILKFRILKVQEIDKIIEYSTE